MNELLVLTQYLNYPQQHTIGVYEANGGYQAIKKAIPSIQPADLIEMVKYSGLKGRGGAGFQTALKWSFIPKNAPVRYLVCNCDESEPGAFKDRLLIEFDPHQLIEGIILASYAIGARFAVVYCRGEYYKGMARLQRAAEEARKKGFLGKTFEGSDFCLELVIHPGAGAYIAGEETALLNSLEGYRATPRMKPPFPAIEGLYGKPTIINNVETLCNVVHIVNKGAEWFRSIGTPNNSGTKIFQVSGQVQKPGCFEFPIGIPLSQVLEAAGGMLPERKFKACFPGGSSCGVLTKDHLDIKMDFDSLAAIGSAFGTASIIVLDDSSDMVKVSNRLMQFYQNESCGKCTPCREGTRWVVQILSRIEAGQGTFDDLNRIMGICHSLETQSFCPLAPGAAFPIASTIKAFRAEFENYIRKNRDAEGSPKMKISYPYLK